MAEAPLTWQGKLAAGAAMVMASFVLFFLALWIIASVLDGITYRVEERDQCLKHAETVAESIKCP